MTTGSDSSKHEVVEIWEAPDWSAHSENPEVCLEALRKYVEERAEAERGWYVRSIGRTRLWSQGLRVLAIVFTGLGGLVPVLVATGVFDFLATKGSESSKQVNYGHFGYLFLALAGSFALADRFFGCSTSWMRYVTTLITQEKLREVFRMEWTSLARVFASKKQPDVAARMIELGKNFLLQLKEQTEKETQAWINEFQSNLSQFEKDLRSQLEATRPGGIDVKVADGGLSREGFDLILDQMIVEHVTGTSGSIGFVPPGLHKVTVSGRVDDKTYTASQMVNVSPAAVAPVELRLGIPDPTAQPPRPPRTGIAPDGGAGAHAAAPP